VPLPVTVVFPGVIVRVHDPFPGKPDKFTLPVDTPLPGWVMLPIIGGDGITGKVFITTLGEASELQPAEFTTVKVYVPVESPDIVVLFPVPVKVFPPGDCTMLHVPPAGNPLKSTLPVEVMQFGCVTWPITGFAGLGSTVSENVTTAAMHFVRLGTLVVAFITKLNQHLRLMEYM
jgi:hypothetical protein